MRSEGRNEDARALLEEGLEPFDVDDPYAFWIAIAAAEIERDEERWGVAFERLAMARQALGPAGAPGKAAGGPMARVWYHGAHGEMWIDLGVPDLAAREFARERELLATLPSPDPNLRRAAVDHELRTLVAEDDFEALRERERVLYEEEAFESEPGEWQAQIGVRFAVGQLEAELRGEAERGEARARFEDLLSRDTLGTLERRWALMHYVLVTLDEGDLETAADALAEWRERLSHDDEDELMAPHHRLALSLRALEARHAILATDAGKTPSVPLAEHLSRLEAVWNDAFLERWSQAPVRTAGLGYLYLSYRHLLAQELIELRLRVSPNGPENALADLLRAQAMGTLSRRLNATAPSLIALRGTLVRDDAGLLLWHACRDRSYVFLVDARGVECERIAPVHTLERTARKLTIAAQRALRSAREDDLDAVEAAARQAANVFLPPRWAERAAGWSHAFAVGLDGVGYVPLELFPSSDGETIGERLALAYLPSIPVGMQLAQRSAPPAPRADGDVWILAETDAPTSVLDTWGLEPLELDGPSDAKGTPLTPLRAAAGKARVLTGPEATIESAASASASDARVLHFLAHGLFDPDRERPAGLLLAGNDGTTWAEDIEAADRAYPELVALTACGTGRGPLRRGDDGRGDLGAAFLARGANAVVLSATPQERDAGLLVARALHEGLSRGLSPAAALQRCRAGRRRDGDRVGALQANLIHALGNAHRPVFAVEPEPEAPRFGRPAVYVVAALILGVVALVRGRRTSVQG